MQIDMTHPNKKETPAEDDKKVIAETIEKRLKEAREAVLNTFKAKKRVEEQSAFSGPKDNQASDN